MLIVNQIKLKLNEKESLLKAKLIEKLHLKKEDIISYEIYQKSIDARKEFYFVYSLKVKLKNEQKYIGKKDVTKYEEIDYRLEAINSDIRPIIVGYGPSGIFAALRLVDAGLKPIVFDRGSRIDKRCLDVDKFFNSGILNPDSNVQFGEGGAGTFSDAKLTTRNKHPFIPYILNKFIEYGANECIRYESHPHIGTDEIRKVIARMTDDLIGKGVSFHFDEAVEDLIIEDHQVKAVITKKDTYYSEHIILAMGHSAYPLFKKLHEKDVYLENKDFSVGFRVEHPQIMIDLNQYKENYGHITLKAAEYFLTAKTSVNKGVYSFCMCPGGYVVPSSADEKTIVTNGMSYAARDNHLANSAILVQINSEDYGNELLAGFDYIHNLEKEAYDISNSYKALAQNIKDYMNDTTSSELIFESTYCLGTTLYDFNKFFKPHLNIAFKEALKHFDKIIPGFIENGIMVGPETKSSCPVRIKRNETYESINTKGLYPCGEGAGYAGGIVSSALDGVKVANQIISNLG